MLSDKQECCDTVLFLFFKTIATMTNGKGMNDAGAVGNNEYEFDYTDSEILAALDHLTPTTESPAPNDKDSWRYDLMFSWLVPHLNTLDMC